MDASLDTQKVEAEIAKLLAETAKLNAEGRKFQRETFLMPFAAGFATLAAAIGAVAALAKLFTH
ncbi:TPA: hypothetical protein ACU967_002215 [Burkholderia contaminans]|uniref:hypothetical protein n=1 Tax=Burkholderia contaminans TaxID=488447 RepID=UPI000CFF2FC4|nr:hypothetical protein [Burkholderia contaminans]HDR9065458.1 hypothetical protein [Burkholderia vietnamiensis]MBM6427897.1 hypothetical protein [Burkholderia contaminans]MCA7876728.1 hypothetical protein [Burkholderia contaminans]MDN8024249.1 hypothetical protein [Burkholderia contaminans]PRG14347.1 hypothetical protein C6Q17_08745 [Burkholderia contaminans]